MDEDFKISLKKTLNKLSKNELIMFCMGQQVEIARLTFFLQSKPEGKILLTKKMDDGSIKFSVADFEE